MFTDKPARQKSIVLEFNRIKLDDIDKKILQILAKKANVTNKAISRLVKLNPESIRMRIKNLEKQNIILNYRTIIKPLKLNKRLFFIFMNLENKDIKKKKIIESFLIDHNKVTYSSNSVGDYNSINVIFAENLDDFRSILLDLRNYFSDSIVDFTSLPISEIEQHTYYPDGFLE